MWQTFCQFKPNLPLAAAIFPNQHLKFPALNFSRQLPLHRYFSVANHLVIYCRFYFFLSKPFRFNRSHIFGPERWYSLCCPLTTFSRHQVGCLQYLVDQNRSCFINPPGFQLLTFLTLSFYKKNTKKPIRGIASALLL